MNGAVFLFVRANRRHLFTLGLSSLLINTLSLALPLFSMLVYDKAVGNRIHDTLLSLTLGVALALALDLALRLSRLLIIEHSAARWDTNLDDRLLRGVLAAPLSRPLPVGTVLTRYRDVAASRDFLSAQYLLPLADLPFCLAFALAVWLVAGPLVVIPVLMGLLLLGASFALHAVGQQRLRIANVAHGRKLTWLVDVLLARESLTTRPAAEVARAHYGPLARQGARASAKSRVWSNLGHQIVPLGLNITTVALLVSGVLRIEAQALSVGGLIAATMLGTRLAASLAGISPVVVRWREFREALLNLRETVNLDLKANTADAMSAGTAALAAGGVHLDHVQFCYQAQGRPVLDGISVKLRLGEMVAVVGNSGSGKSTLLRLLAGHLSATGGGLSVAGERVDDATSQRRLAALSVRKPQEPSFLPGAIREVVTAGTADGPADAAAGETDARVIAALQAVGLGPALERGELGLNTEVGTLGEGISGGQRQMLALARAIFSPAPLLLLDEPTNGLDRSAQDTLLASLRLQRERRCIVIATHAVDVIQQCDRVLVLERGRVLLDGPPSRLLPAAQARPEQASAAEPPRPAPRPMAVAAAQGA